MRLPRRRRRSARGKGREVGDRRRRGSDSDLAGYATVDRGRRSLMEVKNVKIRRSCDHEHEWKDLSADVVGHIAERLSPVDYIHLGRVCRAWKGALSGGLCLPKSPHAPWLMLENNESEDEEDPSSIRFLDVFTEPGRVYKTKIVNYVKGNQVYAAGDGWLVTISRDIKDTTMAWNPFANGEVYHFPSIPTLPANCRGGPKKRRGAVIAEGDNVFVRAELFMAKIKIFKSSETDIMVAIVVNNMNKNIAYARPGDGSWTPLAYYKHSFVRDVVLHQGCIYAVDSEGRVKRWHFITGSYLGEIKIKVSPEWQRIFLLEYHMQYFATYDDKLVMLWSAVSKVDTVSGGGYLHMVLFELDSNNMAWNFLTRLGGGALFVDLNLDMDVNGHGNAMILNHLRLQDQIILASASDNNIFEKQVRFYDLVLQNFRPDNDILPYTLSNYRITRGWFMPTLSRS